MGKRAIASMLQFQIPSMLCVGCICFANSSTTQSQNQPARLSASQPSIACFSLINSACFSNVSVAKACFNPVGKHRLCCGEVETRQSCMHCSRHTSCPQPWPSEIHPNCCQLQARRAATSTGQQNICVHEIGDNGHSHSKRH